MTVTEADLEAAQALSTYNFGADVPADDYEIELFAAHRELGFNEGRELGAREAIAEVVALLHRAYDEAYDKLNDAQTAGDKDLMRNYAAAMATCESLRFAIERGEHLGEAHG